MTRLEALKDKVSPEHEDVYLNAVRTVKAIDDLGEQHRTYVAVQGIAGIKPNGEYEAMFYEVLSQARNAIIETLEKEIEDWLHKGDKNYKRNFK